MSKTKQFLRPVIVALVVIGGCALESCGSTVSKEAIIKRDIICANQEYNPKTAKHDIEMCRKGFNKKGSISSLLSFRSMNQQLL
ncbi:Uncharacterised protein [Enterobacter hormaechei]|nr:Uncharacterised protein [Enterobacter hormaechei]